MCWIRPADCLFRNAWIALSRQNSRYVSIPSNFRREVNKLVEDTRNLIVRKFVLDACGSAEIKFSTTRHQGRVQMMIDQRLRWLILWNPKHRSEERRVGKECRSR